MKQLIGIFRIALYIVVMYSFDISLDPYDLKLWVSDMIHGAHTPELRNSAIVWFVNFLILGASSFYIIQSLVYILAGSALDGKNTGIFRFLKLFTAGIVDAVRDPRFWSSSDISGGLPQIDKVMQYRDNKMAMMSNKEAISYMNSTAQLDQLVTSTHLKQSRKALSYMNNKMAMMSNESAIKWLQGGAK
jgi:hypothetical protein